MHLENRILKNNLKYQVCNEIYRTSEVYAGRRTGYGDIPEKKEVSGDTKKPKYRHAGREKGTAGKLTVKQKRARGGCLGTGSRRKT